MVRTRAQAQLPCLHREEVAAIDTHIADVECRCFAPLLAAALAFVCKRVDKGHMLGAAFSARSICCRLASSSASACATVGCGGSRTKCLSALPVEDGRGRA